LLFTLAEIGAPKALAAAARLRLHHPASEIVAHETNLDARNARALVAGHDVVLDCTDNFAARFVLHDACHALGVPLVSAAVHRFEGTLDVFRRGEGGCVHCLWPARRADELDVAGNCAAGPVFAPAVGVLGTLQASEALKLLLGVDAEATRRTTLVNVLDNSFLTIARPARADCPVCGQPGTAPSGALVSGARDDASALLDRETFAALVPAPRIVRLAEPDDTSSAPDIVSPHDLARLRELAAEGPIALTCRSGVRSVALARLLRAEGVNNVYALSRAD
jgi:adenylyltransferase/sulfurtransferase